jgi:hypothetical protein
MEDFNKIKSAMEAGCRRGIAWIGGRSD